jgi:hypothetical protein
MTTTILEQDLDLTLFEEFESERSCESGAKQCGNKAEWLAILQCCKTDKALCTPCKNISDAIDTLWAGAEFVCHFCGATFIQGPWWVRWEKL